VVVEHRLRVLPELPIEVLDRVGANRVVLDRFDADQSFLLGAGFGAPADVPLRSPPDNKLGNRQPCGSDELCDLQLT
jgi:hypothetical protein